MISQNNFEAIEGPDGRNNSGYESGYYSDDDDDDWHTFNHLNPSTYTF